MKILKECNLCKNKNFEFLFTGQDTLHNISGKFNLYRCKNCGLMFINPQPTIKELERYYPKNYYSFSRITKSDSLKIKLKLFLYNLYYNPQKRNILLRALFLPLRGFVRGTLIKSKAKILDVGCGSGQFLYEMKTLGMNAYGVEPGSIDENEAKKERLNIVNGTLENAKYPDNFFDIITINHVLEHVNDPAGTIKEMFRILKRGGMLIIGVPSYSCPEAQIFGKDWESLDIPRHLFDFSDTILIDYLKKSNFKIVNRVYSGRADNLFPPLMSLLVNPEEKLARKNLFRHYTATILSLIFNPLLNLFKVGSQVEIFCIKR